MQLKILYLSIILLQAGVCLPVAELHGLCSRCPLIQQGGVGDRHACDVTNHRLIIEKGLQAALRDLRLVRRVLSHPEDKDWL